MPSFLQHIFTFSKKHWLFLAYLAFALFVRFWNFENSIYFIYDQGRDAMAIQKIVHGDFTLVGPTSGLPGFFIGPAWFYLGVPGYVLSGGNPFILNFWYALIGCLALPLYWWASHKLFKNKIFALLCAFLLAVIPGSLRAAIFVWNPLMSVPLMMGALYSFWRARTSQLWLGIGFFLVALTLQSEFAYAVFFLPVLFVLIPWIRKRFHWKDFVIATGAIGVTLIPQILFDLRNQFIMTKSLLGGSGGSENAVPWKQLFEQRPHQLIDTSMELLFSPAEKPPLLVIATLILFLIGVWAVWQRNKGKKLSKERTYLWQLTTLFAIIPYPFFMIWRGNHGFFFWYYITSHYIFLIPLIVMGMYALYQRSLKNRMYIPLTIVLMVITLVGFGYFSFQNWYNVVWSPDNNAGLKKIYTAVEKLYAWSNEDQANPRVIRTYTANILTEQYDYVIGWYARKHDLQIPLTTQTGNEEEWYLLIERKDQAPKIFFEPWYTTATQSGVQTREEEVGVLTIESWQRKKP